jgi:hypothetical protein
MTVLSAAFEITDKVWRLHMSYRLPEPYKIQGKDRAIYLSEVVCTEVVEVFSALLMCLTGMLARLGQLLKSGPARCSYA